ncbi:hypothetical protein VFPBJ_08878 [Purpureocillium lilacinum]|uniref:Uncharacterized protein n=1 Tax=Purpureocillium lilacinum TaxID=33203 RepID=A0A179GG81_PURLI|nr:hypothetical protein VFPBJ_08878 [Purpureocillium lilacinum]GJN75934.1 hypothetical protein PLICBS_010044 [Purpureocillium lilacinum]
MESTIASLSRSWQRMNRGLASRPKLFRRAPTSAPARETNTFSLTKELRRNAGMSAAIVVLSILILGLEIVAHAGFPHSAWRNENSGARPSQQAVVSQALAPSHCGSSAEEARRLGCLFDELSFAWQAPACYDKETIDEFQAAGSWEFFADEYSAEAVPHDQLALTEEPVHVTFRFHIAHCLFLRRQMVRLLLRGAAMDTHLGAYRHTVHCGKTMLNKAGRGNDRHTRAPVIYPVCKPLQDWKS